MNTTSFVYHNIPFTIYYNLHDTTGLGSIREIVESNDYILNQFVDYENDVFIDIGANLGIATIIMAKLNPKSTVYAFEPYLPAYELLLKNIEANGLKNVKPFNLAVSDRTGDILELSVFPTMSGANSTFAIKEKFDSLYHHTVKPLLVTTISLDDIIKTNNMDNIKLFKIDCEGAEFKIIYGSEEFKKGIVGNMVGEFHDLNYNNVDNNSHELIKYCKQYVNGLVKISVLRIM